MRNKSNTSKIPSVKSSLPSISSDYDEYSQTSDDITDRMSLFNSITRNSQIVKSKTNTGSEDSKVYIEKKLLANVVNDHFKFYDILHRMLPPKAIDELNRGEQVMPEEFGSVTIFFSDIVGFTEIASRVHPLLIVKLLNQLYSVMDFCATFFPLFKVETYHYCILIIMTILSLYYYHYYYPLQLSGRNYRRRLYDRRRNEWCQR